MHSHMYICHPPLTYVHMSTTFNAGNVDIILQKSFILQICYGKIYFQKNHERIVIHLAKAWCQLCQSWVHLFPSLGQNPLLQVKIEPFRTSKVASTAGSVRPFNIFWPCQCAPSTSVRRYSNLRGSLNKKWSLWWFHCQYYQLSK